MSRDQLTDIAELCWEIHDDDCASPRLKSLARRTNRVLDELLVYGPEWITLQPITFTPLWGGFYEAMVEEFLLDLGEEVTEQQQARVVMARQAAKAVDYQGYGTEYRLDCLESLNQVLAALADCKAELEIPTFDEMVERLERRNMQ